MCPLYTSPEFGTSHIRYFFVFNKGTVSSSKRKEIMEAMAVVSSDGTVLWIPQVEAEISCSRDVERFPNDEQTCIFKVGV